MEQDESYARAKREVARIKGFYIHLTVFAAVMLLLLVIDLFDAGPWWFQWPLLGWGIGVAVHALGVFGLGGLFGPQWEEKKVRELMDRH